jgi:hypothetical protein
LLFAAKKLLLRAKSAEGSLDRTMLGTRPSRHDQTNKEGIATLLAGANLNPSDA